MANETLDLYEAANFLKMHWQTLRSKAKCGEIPGAKISKRWVFLTDDLASHLRSNYSVPRPRSQAQQVGDTLCCSSDQIRDSGGAASPHQTDVEYNNLLKQ